VRERPSALLFLELLELPLGLFDQRCAADRGVELLDQLNDNPLFHPPPSGRDSADGPVRARTFQSGFIRAPVSDGSDPKGWPSIKMARRMHRLSVPSRPLDIQRIDQETADTLVQDGR
jgi:hypothetical protein